MARRIDWDRQIGRRLKLRDLHMFLTAVHCGSMSKAAADLAISQPVVSEAIANLEHVVGVRLLDRGPQGIEPTVYGRALLTGSLAALDDLKQSIKHIEFLADPTAGEIRIGCPETVAAILPPIIESFSRQFPGVVLHVSDVVAPTLDLPLLRDRSLDFALVRAAGPLSRHHFGDDLNAEAIFGDETLVVTGSDSRWAGRRKIDLAELVNERWILPPADTLNANVVDEAFRTRGLDPPKVNLVTFSVQLRANLVADGRYLTVLPRSMMHLYGERMSLKALPLNLPAREWVVAIVTLKNRTLNPPVQLFVKHIRASMRSMATARPPRHNS